MVSGRWKLARLVQLAEQNLLPFFPLMSSCHPDTYMLMNMPHCSGGIELVETKRIAPKALRVFSRFDFVCKLLLKGKCKIAFFFPSCNKKCSGS